MGIMFCFEPHNYLVLLGSDAVIPLGLTPPFMVGHINVTCALMVLAILFHQMSLIIADVFNRPEEI